MHGLSLPSCIQQVGSGKKYMGATGDFAPEMQKSALDNLENQKEPLKIAIDCNVKASVGCEK